MHGGEAGSHQAAQRRVVETDHAHLTWHRDATARPRRKPSRRPAWQERPSLAGRTAKTVILSVVVLAVLLPLYTVVLTSLSTEKTINQAGGGMVLIPGELTLSAYSSILTGGVITRSVMVSIGVTAVGTLLSTAVSVLAAYGLSRTDSLLHRPILFIVLITMFFSAGMIPVYLVVSGLGLIDSFWALILPGAVSAFNILILRSFFMGIDSGILEAARIDGAGEFRILATIVLPMSTAVIAGVAGSERPSSLAVKMAIVVLALVPILLVYPFVQKHFTKGVIFGAIKG